MQRKAVKLLAAISVASPGLGATPRGTLHYDARGRHLVPRDRSLARAQAKWP